ncbi:hypothetical protein BGX20_006673 [Mortierella sp. AD010]|nr:hypothetical protein BGX20_006673 [Mortierella sp. AD010]
MDYVVTPWTEDMAENDDGDGPRVGNSLRYWYTDFNRSLLRLVCRTWNLTILSMAREINVELGSDESMASLSESVAAERRSATTTQTRASQHLPFSSASSSFWSSSDSGVRLHRTLRRSARLFEASTSVPASAASRPTSNPSYSYASTAEEPRISEDFNRYVGSHGIQSDQHPRLVQHIAQKLSENRRVVNQNFLSIGRFYNSFQFGRDSTKASAIASGSINNRTQHQTGGNGTTTSNSSSPPRGLTNGRRHGTKLDHWLRAAVPKTITSFSISSSSDFGMDGLLLLPESLTTLTISRCPRLTGGTLFITFNHLSNLTRLTMCTELLFTDESFISALGNLTHLQQFDYMYPCDSVQPAWRDLFRYCSSCELYHRRMATKTYTRKLLMPVLPPQIRQFNFSMDEPRFRHQRIENSDQNNQFNSDRDNTKFWLCLWKADEADPQNTNSSVGVDSGDQGSDHKSEVGSMQGSMPRSWWPENLTRLDLSRCAVFDSRFDVPSQLKELVIAYPLEPNEIQMEGSDSKLEEDKQWFPESLVSLEVHGAPYHVSCEIYDNPSGNVASWMNYTNTMLKRVPRHLEHFIITSFQVPDTDALNALQARVGKTLKTWVVKLLCPQRPKKSGHSSLQLYTPAVYVENNDNVFNDDEGVEEMVDDSWWSWMGMSSDDSDLDFYQESPSSRASGRVFRRQRSGWSSLNGSSNIHSPRQEETRHLTDSEQYSVTPVMLRNATKGMVVLEKLEVHVNFQHYRFCQSIWKDCLGLSEPVSVDVFGNDARDLTNLTPAGSSSRISKGKSSSSSLFSPSSTPTLKMNVHLRDSGEDVLDLVTKYRLKKKKLSPEDLLTQYQYAPSLLQRIEEKEKGVYREAHLGSKFLPPVDIKGKGKKVESSLSLDGGWSPLKDEEDEYEGMTANPPFDSILEHFESFSKSKGDSNGNSGSNNISSKILEHGKVRGCPTTKIVYWNNSCCGKRCLGWSRNHH